MFLYNSRVTKFCRFTATKTSGKATNTLPATLPYVHKEDSLEYRKRKHSVSRRPRIRDENALKALGNTHFTSEAYKKDFLPFRSAAKNMAVKRGEILPKDIEDKIVIERKPEGLDFYFKDDPGYFRDF
jgi:hypothetical protein